MHYSEKVKKNNNSTFCRINYLQSYGHLSFILVALLFRLMGKKKQFLNFFVGRMTCKGNFLIFKLEI